MRSFCPGDSHTYNMRSTTASILVINWLFILTFLTAACGGNSSANSGSGSNAKPSENSTDTAESKATFIAVGDMMLSRGVEHVIESGGPLMPFSQMAETLSSSDFNFGNFEAPISGNDGRMGKGLVFNVRTKDIDGLIKYKFKVVGLANNHAFDQGLAGLRNTIAFLNQKGIENTGTGEDKRAAWTPRVIEANGIRFGFLAASYASVNDGGVTKNQYVARIEDIDEMKTAIAKLKTECDIVVVAMHAGIEYTRNPEKGQIAFARAVIEAGADVMIGAHPHWIQTIEKYQGKYIFYSLGNFIFDQRKPDTKEGLSLRITAKRSGGKTVIDQIELMPVVIEKMGVPRRATPQETAAILKKIDIIDPVLKP